MKLRPWFFFLAIAAAGCSDDGDDKFTDHYSVTDLGGSYGAFADEGNFRILAAFLGGGNFLRLRGGDTVEVRVNGVQVAQKERIDEGDKVHYVVDEPPPPEEMAVEIAFVRNLERVVGTVRVAHAFEFVNPPTTTSIGSTVDIDIDPRPDLSKWPGFFGPGLVAKAEIVADCLESGSQEIDLCSLDSTPDNCTQGYPLKLDTTKLIFRPNTTTCELSVQVRLNSNGGKYEAQGPQKQNFKGGGFDAYRAKSFKMTVTK